MRLRPDRTSLHRQSREEARRYDREILGLALPALGALLAEPLFLLTDSAIIGHLGTQQLAGLGVASAVLLNAVFLCIFLAHGTTSAVARLAGAGDLRRAHTQGVDGIWLGLCIGVALAAVGIPLAPWLVDLLGASEGARPYAVTYLRVSLFGLPSMLVVLAATGALRGLKDTRTPLLATGLAAVVNVPLNLVLVYPLGLGVAGSALGTVIAQTGAAVWLCAVVVRGARRHRGTATTGPSGHRGGRRRERAAVRPHRPAAHRPADHDVRGRRRGGRRDRQPPDRLHAVVPARDAAGVVRDRQPGHGRPRAGRLGPGRRRERPVAAPSRGDSAAGSPSPRCWWPCVPAYIPLFTDDPAVRDLVWSLAVVVAASQPVGALLYVLDGILIGAGDLRYLAWTMLVALVVFLPLAAVGAPRRSRAWWRCGGP